MSRDQAVATPYVAHEEYDEATLETKIEIGWEWDFCPDCGKEGAHPTNDGHGGIRCG